ncbi:MAG TPA: ThiF family adenylyltransferase [Candidatus Nitrosotalea sp.]|nr:ThiF family adenylyltransferase [Nitrososphaerota archaeon]HKU33000.1 ThiF family adenylyltransferase [Candidatus Nitrosotalea sp.]
MASIKFTIPSVLNKGGGEKKVDISATTLSEAFNRISEQLGDEFKRRVLNPDGTPRSLINIYVNGKNMRFSGGMETSLKDGDEIYILPAVAGGSELSSKELERYSRQVMLEEIGYEGQLKLRNKKACVVGVGGLGNPIVSRLVAMGVGKIRIVDRDVVELSNLHRQTMFDESDVGQVKVEAAEKKLKKMNSDVTIEALPVSVNDYTALDIVEGCDVVIDALDSVNARYSLNKACVKKNIPFVTGAAVGVSGQVFTILPNKTACYHCVFPSLDENSMPTCSTEGVHPSILSIVGGIEVAEAVKVLIERPPTLANKLLYIDLDNLDFSTAEFKRVDECSICGKGKKEELPQQELIIEELCGRNRGKRTFSITPTKMFEIDVPKITNVASTKGFKVQNQGELGLSISTNDIFVSFLKRGSAVIVGEKDEDSAIALYKVLVNA